jgi:hypothetical protein
MFTKVMLPVYTIFDALCWGEMIFGFYEIFSHLVSIFCWTILIKFCKFGIDIEVLKNTMFFGFQRSKKSTS